MANPQWPGGQGAPGGDPQQAGYPQQQAQPAYPQAQPQQGYALAAPPTSGLQLTTSFIFLQWFLYFKQPRLEINGQDQPISWGTSFVPVPPGNYNMRIFVPGLFMPHFDTHAPLMVYPNHISGYTWETAFFIFMSGSLRELGYKPYGT